jgi:hypothetical protein
MDSISPVVLPSVDNDTCMRAFSCVTQHDAPPRAHRQPLPQLMAARISIELVLAAVRLRRPRQDLARDLLIAAVGLARGVRLTLRSIDCDDDDEQQPRQPQTPITPGESSASAASCRRRNCAVVE